MFNFLITLIFGMTLGVLLLVISLLHLLQIKCPQCKQFKPLHQIILFHWKARIITGQPCQKCQRPRPQVSIEL